MSQLSIKSSELISKFKASKIPSSKFPKDFLIHQDLVFNTESTTPSVSTNLDFNNSFISESKKFNNYNNHPTSSGNAFQKGKNSQKVDEESNDFFDNFKGKFNPKDVSTFKRNAEMLSRNAVSIQYTKKKFVDLLDKSKKVDFYSVDDFFGVDDEKQVEESNANEAKDKPALQIKEESVFIKSNTYLALEIPECIYLVNEKLGYPKDKPLWYIYHEGAESSYGPLSSKTILEMLNIKLLTIESKIRFIDIFVYRGCPQFEFFNIKDIKRNNFHENIRVSEFAKLAPISLVVENHKDEQNLTPLNIQTVSSNSNSGVTQNSIYDIAQAKLQSSKDEEFFDNRKLNYL